MDEKNNENDMTIIESVQFIADLCYDSEYTDVEEQVVAQMYNVPLVNSLFLFKKAKTPKKAAIQFLLKMYEKNEIFPILFGKSV